MPDRNDAIRVVLDLSGFPVGGRVRLEEARPATGLPTPTHWSSAWIPFSPRQERVEVPDVPADVLFIKPAFWLDEGAPYAHVQMDVSDA